MVEQVALPSEPANYTFPPYFLFHARAKLILALVTYHKITDPIDWINLLLIQCRILSQNSGVFRFVFLRALCYNYFLIKHESRQSLKFPTIYAN